MVEKCVCVCVSVCVCVCGEQGGCLYFRLRRWLHTAHVIRGSGCQMSSDDWKTIPHFLMWFSDLVQTLAGGAA